MTDSTTTPDNATSTTPVLNGYICFYKGKRLEVYAATTLAAQTEAAKQFRAKKAYEVSVHLAEIGGQPYVHVATD